jgi:hypothetical protein
MEILFSLCRFCLEYLTYWFLSAAASNPLDIDFVKKEVIMCGNQVFKKENSLPVFLEAFRTLHWFSYRKDFACITPSHYTTDMGWGCMLRSGQMMLANTFSRHFLGPGTKYIEPSSHLLQGDRYLLKSCSIE